MSNVVSQKHLQQGALWTFVHSSGKRTEYVFDRVMRPASAGFTAVVALLNPATGKEAQITERWLREGPSNGRAHWIPKAEAVLDAA